MRNKLCYWMIHYALFAWTLILVCTFAPSYAHGISPADSLQELVAQAWQIVDTSYAGTAFDAQAWKETGADFTSRHYGSTSEAYRALHEMLARLHDPATRLLTAAQFAAFLREVSGQPHVGVGLLEMLSIDVDESTGQMCVVTPMPGTPAARAGLRPRDVIEAINGVATTGMSLSSAMAHLRLATGEAVRLNLKREDRVQNVNLQCDSIVSPFAAVQAFSTMARNRRIGYLGLRQFAASAGGDFRKALQELLAQHVAAVILDLRSNPGGYLPVCTDIAGMFLGAKPMAMILGRGNNFALMQATGEKLTDVPMAVLVNAGTASAAELLAAALHSHGRATVIGSRTFGKGLVHGMQPLSDGAMLILTMGALQTLEGREILHNGIVPDVLEEMPASPVVDASVALASPQDRQYQKAVAILVK